MSSNFPTSLDSLTNPSATDTTNNPSHATQHSNANDIVEALEAKVGVDSSAVTTSHDYLLTHLPTQEGSLNMGSKDIINIGSVGATGTRVTKLWATDIESTNDITISGTALAATYASIGQTMYIGTTGVAINRGTAALTLAGITLTTPDIGTPSAGTLTNCTFPTLNQNTTGSAATVTNATFTTALTVNTGTLTLTANVGNDSVLTIGSGAVSVSGSNTGDQDLSGKANVDQYPV